MRQRFRQHSTSLLDDRGGIATILGLAAIPVILGLGLAVDAVLAYNAQSRLQGAVDSAALAGAQDMTAGAADMKTDARMFFNSNYPADYLGGHVVDFDAEFDSDKLELKVDAEVEVPTAFMHLAGVPAVTVAATATARQDFGGIELALVLDITGSMNDLDPSGGTKLEALKKASALLLDELYGEEELRDGISVAVVPYNSVVNVGDDREAWLDEEPDDDEDDSDDDSDSDDAGDGSSSSESFDFSGYGYGGTDFGMSGDDASDEGWRGCVEARSDTMDRDDTPPSDENFSAMVWPSVNSYFNPYNFANHLCPTSEILPLTAEKSEVLDSIDDLTADGATVTTVGFVWGWRAISPRWRDAWDLESDAPVDYDDTAIKKAIVFMTDGITVIHPGNDYYNAYGFTEDGRLGTTNNEAAEDEADRRLLESCQLAKAQGIEVYTVMYALEDSTIEQLYRDCATSEAHFFDAPDGPRLIAAFRNIAGKMTSLHLSR